MTDRELFEMALEALVSENSLSAVAMQQRMDSITALRARLAEPTIKQCLTVEKEPEPVAWMYVNSDGECEQIEYETPPDDPSVTPLYAYPPARRPLTDEKIYEMYNEPRSDAEMIDFARAIEAAHGIKEPE